MRVVSIAGYALLVFFFVADDMVFVIRQYFPKKILSFLHTSSPHFSCVMKQRCIFFCCVCACLCLSGAYLSMNAQVKDTSFFLKSLKYRLVGPAWGGRISRVAGVVGNPSIYYAATASGGVWKSVNGGTQWSPIFDDQPTASIGAIAVAPSDPNIVYVGSGEANIRGNVAPGNGLYVSRDAGKTWTHTWKQEGQIGTIAVHPTQSNIAFAAVLGKAFSANPERGIYRTKDGGKTWEKVLFVSNQAGASDVAIDPSNPNIILAGTWFTVRKPWDMISGGPGSGLWMSRDGGDTWTQLKGNGLPDGLWGKVGVAIAPTNGSRMYVLIEHENGGLFRSDNGGENWTRINGSRILRQRAWYYSTMTIDPKDQNTVWFPQVPMLRTTDGGRTIQQVRGLHHGDHHDVWINPTDTRYMIAGHDGGLDVSWDAGKTWYAPPLPLNQIYHLGASVATPYHVSATLQDIGTACAPSNTLAGGIRVTDWFNVGGGEAGHIVHHPVDSTIVYAGEYGGAMTRYDMVSKQARNMTAYPYNPSGHGAEDLKYRFQWTAPIAYSPHAPYALYHGGNVLFKTLDGGRSWKAISGDLTRNDKSKQQWTGGPITGDNTGVETYCTIFAIAESPVQKDLLWVGSDDGLVHVSSNGGVTWNNVTKNIPGLPEFATIRTIEPSRYSAGTAYLVADAHRLGDNTPYLWKTTDFGKTWKSLTKNLDQNIYLHVVREDSKRQGLLFIGSEIGVNCSYNDGETFRSLRLNMPTVAVHDLLVKDNDLIVGTHGRSIYILDDMTPVRELQASDSTKSLHLYSIPPSIRWRYGRAKQIPGSFANPPEGVVITYALLRSAQTVTMTITNARGEVVRTYQHKPKEFPAIYDEGGGEKYDSIPNKAGIHRVVWDMSYEGCTLIADAKIDGGEPTAGPLVPPGTYTVTITADGLTVSTSCVLKADPRVAMTVKELEEQVKEALAMRDDMGTITRMVNHIRFVKKQLVQRNEVLSDDTTQRTLIDASKKMIARIDSLEGKLHNPKAEVSYDILAMKGGTKLYSVLGQLYDYCAASDGPVTQGMKEMYDDCRTELMALRKEFLALMQTDIPALNKQAQSMNAPHTVLPKL
jgi:photosystem II stability/assembly factor-like uncharacterized protein